MKPKLVSIENRKIAIQLKRQASIKLNQSGLLCNICTDLCETCQSCLGRLKNRRCRKCGGLMHHDYFYHEYCCPDSEILDPSWYGAVTLITNVKKGGKNYE